MSLFNSVSSDFGERYNALNLAAKFNSSDIAKVLMKYNPEIFTSQQEEDFWCEDERLPKHVEYINNFL